MNNNAKKLLKIFIILLVLYSLELGYLYSKSIILNVNGENVTKTQFNKIFEENANASGFLLFGIDINKDKKNFLYLMIQDKTIDDLIKQTLIEQEIKKKHIKVNNKELNKELENSIKNAGSKENFNVMLKINQTSLSQFKKDLNNQIEKKKLAESVSKINVSDAEAKKYYTENITNYKQEATVKVSHIFIAANSQKISQEIKSKPENKNLNDKEIQAEVKKEQKLKLEKAKKLLSALKKNPELFAKLAKENSDDKSNSQNGGDLGNVGKNQMSEIIKKVVFKIKLNTISDIVKTPNGYHILIVSDRTKNGYKSFENVKNDIILILKKQKQDAVLDNLANTLKKQAKIKYLNSDYIPKTVDERYKKP